jgi:hypothetical protein
MRRSRWLLLAAIPLAALLAFLFHPGRRAVAPATPAASAHPSTAPAARPPSGLPLRLPDRPEAREARVAAGPARFEGRVVSAATGAGIAGAELTFSRGGAADSVRSAGDGSFTFEPASTGRWLLAAVTAPGHFPFAPEWGHSPVQLVAEPGRQVKGIEIHLTPAVELEGRVVQPDGQPVPGAEVRLLGAADEAVLVGIPDRFKTDERGSFRAAAPEGSVLEGRVPGQAPGHALVDALALLNGRVTVVLGPALETAPAPRARLAGRVLAASGGEPIPGALVVARSGRGPGPGGSAAAQAVTGADGRFELSDLATGDYRLSARAEGHAPGTARATAGSPDEVVIELLDGGRLRGCVRDAASGEPVAPFTVLVFLRRNALWVVQERSLSVIDPSGCYTLDDLRPGASAVVFSAPGRAPSAELSVDVPAPPAEAVLDGRLEAGGTLTGVVRDDASGAPIPGARLGVEGALSAAASTFPVLSEAVTSPDGAFRLGGLPRRFSVQAAAAGHHARVVGGLGAQPGAVSGPIEIRLRPLAPGEEPGTDLAGIGVVVAPRDDGLLVTRVAAGSGASEAGLATGDVVLAVDGQPVTELGFGDSVDMIRGPEGTFVVLQIRRGDATVEVRVPRRLVRG